MFLSKNTKGYSGADLTEICQRVSYFNCLIIIIIILCWWLYRYAHSLMCSSNFSSVVVVGKRKVMMSLCLLMTHFVGRSPLC